MEQDKIATLLEKYFDGATTIAAAIDNQIGFLLDFRLISPL